MPSPPWRMRQHCVKASIAAAILVSVLQLSCGDHQPSPSPIAPSTARSVTVVLVPLGTPYQATAVVGYSDGSSRDVTSDAQWSSSNAEVATVSTAGLVTPKGVGQTEIRATYDLVSGGAQLSVTEMPAAAPPPSDREFWVRGTVRDALDGEMLQWGRVERTQDGNKAGTSAPYEIYDGKFAFLALANRGLNITTVVNGYASQSRALVISGDAAPDFSLVPLPVTLNGEVWDSYEDAHRPVLCPVRVDVLDGPNAGKFATTGVNGTAYEIRDLEPAMATVRISARGYQSREQSVRLRGRNYGSLSVSGRLCRNTGCDSNAPPACMP